MNDTGEGLRGRLSARGEEALGEVAQALLENPVFKQMLDAAFGARDAASSATAQALKNLNLPTGSEVDRLERRLRGLSERLEAIEDRLDELAAEAAAARRRDDPGSGEPRP
jgi:hypothetical protein